MYGVSGKYLLVGRDWPGLGAIRVLELYLALFGSRGIVFVTDGYHLTYHLTHNLLCMLWGLCMDLGG